MTIQNIIAKVAVFVSNVCRIEVTPELAQLAKPGITPIPVDVLPLREIKVTNKKITFPASMSWHRDAFIPTIEREVAAELVARGDAESCEQSLLCYSMADYLKDGDVKANADDTDELASRKANERAKAQAAADDGVDTVVVAVIGENRSPLAVCRNVVSGCQKPESLEDDAKGAIEAANTFLVE